MDCPRVYGVMALVYTRLYVSVQCIIFALQHKFQRLSKILCSSAPRQAHMTSLPIYGALARSFLSFTAQSPKIID